MTIRQTALTLGFLTATGIAFAHHSFAPYDIRNAIEITGVAEEFRYMRPHPRLTFLDDSNVEWDIEIPLMFWNRAGLAPDAIKAGDELVVLGWPARNGDPEMALSGFTLDGTFFSVLEEVRQRSAVEAAEAIEAGESLESVLEEHAE